MKQFIVLIATIPILLTLVLNFGQITLNSSKEKKVNELVYTSVQLAKQEGCFTAKNIKNLKTEISKIMKIDEDRIEIEADQTPRYRVNEYNENELISYRVIVPVDKIVAGNKIFGISDSENKGQIIIENAVVSERLRP